jgi:RND family efflux transporter MFP subunit
VNKKLAVFIVIIGITALPLVAGCGNSPAPEGMVEDEAPLMVATAGVEDGVIEEMAELTGTIAARQTVNVVPKAVGRAVQVAVKVGDQVNRGDLIVSLETEEISLQLKQAEAGLAVAEANLAAMKIGARPGERVQANNAVAQAEANYENAKQNTIRMEALYVAGAIPLQQLEAAQLQLVQAETGYKSAKETQAILEQGATKENLAVAEAQVKQAEAGAALIRAQLKNAMVTAPITGVVAAVNIEQGELAGAGMPVAIILNTDMVDVEINVSEANINQVNKGSEVKVLVSAVSSEPLIGIVETVSPAVNPQTRQFPVKISLQNQEGLLKPGMFARVFLVTAKETNALKIPKEAVVADNGRPYVYVVVNGVAVKKEVILGLRLTNNSRIQIISGLVLGEEVVIKGQHRLADGRAVMVENGGKR